MSRIEEKMEHFANDVMADVGEERRKMIQALDDELRKEYEQQESQHLGKAYELIQDALISIDQKKNESMSRIIMRNRTKLFDKRNEIIDGIYKKAIDRLKAFKETEDYLAFLVKHIKKAEEALGEGVLSVKLDYSDRALVDRVKKATGLEVVVESKKVPLLGGSIVINKDSNMIVDQTFSRKLDSIREDFVQQCQIEIE